jgi:hypothetical protein
MFAVVLQEEHEKLSARNRKKSKKTPKIFFDESSDSSQCDMSVTHLTMSENDCPFDKDMDKMDEDQTYLPKIKNIESIINED